MDGEEIYFRPEGISATDEKELAHPGSPEKQIGNSEKESSKAPDHTGTGHQIVGINHSIEILDSSTTQKSAFDETAKQNKQGSSVSAFNRLLISIFGRATGKNSRVVPIEHLTPTTPVLDHYENGHPSKSDMIEAGTGLSKEGTLTINSGDLAGDILQKCNKGTQILVHKRKRSSLVSHTPKAGHERKHSRPKLKRVHFMLPKTAASKRSISWQALDPKHPILRRWLTIMLFPLSYEIWAFPYRLALGFPSIESDIYIADSVCDIFFIVDMFISLRTALPAIPGQQEAIKGFPEISRNYFSKIFPLQILPSVLYWIVTLICASYGKDVCQDGLQNTRRSKDAGSTSGAERIENSHWSCVMQHIDWRLWLWWVMTIPRSVPRFHRLLSYFKSMENDLVSLHRVWVKMNFYLIWVFLGRK
jgi:hypothetical protein